MDHHSPMDYTMHHPHQNHLHHHHHPHHHHPSGPTSPHAASRCPALRAAAEQRAIQHAPSSPTRGSVYYDPVHGDISNRDPWPHRVPQSWQPALIPPPASHDPYMAGMLPALAPPNQSMPSPAAFPALSIPSYPNAQQETHMPAPQAAPFHPFRPMMHPVPHLPLQHGSRGFRHLNRTDNAQHPTARPVQILNHSGPSTASTLFTTPPPAAEASPPADQGSSTGNQNSRANEQPPSLFGRMNSNQAETDPFTTQAQTLSNDEVQSRPASSSTAVPNAGISLQRRPGQTDHPAEPRRFTVGGRGSRRSYARNSATMSDWPEDPSARFLEYVHTGGFPEGDGPIRNQPMFRGGPPGKRVASKKALASLQSVEISDLPENERTCVICYNEFGVVNPDGLNEAPLRLPKCKHVFGDHCIKKWFEESDSCPYCRDKVHSDPQHVRGPRNTSVLRLMRHYQQNHTRYGQARNESFADPEPMHPAPPQGDSSSDSTHGFWSQQQPGNSSENRNTSSSETHGHSSHWDRHSPPSDDNERPRTRPRHNRARGSQSWSRPGLLGGSGANNVSQTSVRLPRTTRSRSPPLAPGSSGARDRDQQSLTSSPQQPRWFGMAPQNPNQRDFSGSSSRNAQYYVQPPPSLIPSQLSVQAEEFFHPLTSPNEPRSPPSSDYNSFVQQLRPELQGGRSEFLRPSTSGSIDVPMGNTEHMFHNPYSSYQRS